MQQHDARHGSGTGRVLAALCPALVLLGSFPAAAQSHLADHLVLSEVGYDVITESGGTTAEFIEIYNPTDRTISLNDGAVPGVVGTAGSYFLTDNALAYVNLPSGKVFLDLNSDSVYQFPLGASIPPHGIVVVCGDSDTFLNEFFGGNLSAFQGLPGAPQLFETRQDNDTVFNMVIQSTYPGGTVTALSLTNTGEPAILFYWDGSSSTVQDVDIAVWKLPGEVPNKSAVPGYLPDTPSALVAGTAPATNAYSLQRRSLEEGGEIGAGGNGLTGHDETSEAWSGTGSSWIYALHGPGLPYLAADGVATDALSFLAPVAVSAADGPGTGLPADYGQDGTLTELYLAPADTNGDRLPDGLYVGVRGSLFGSPDTGANATLVLIDLDPGTGTGARRLVTANDVLIDETGTLDARITHAGFVLEPAGMGFDAALGVDDVTGTAEVQGWRSWGSPATSGASGTFSDFAWLAGTARFCPSIPPVFPGAPGTTVAGEDAIEGTISWTALRPAGAPSYVSVVAVTTADAGNAASPNTLPESLGDAYDMPQILDRAVCWEVAAGRAIAYFEDLDGDGWGSARVSSYCGPLTAGVALSSGDCDDARSAAHPGGVETCNGLDDDCDGLADEGNPEGGGACDAGLPGICATGVLTCQSGSLACVPDVVPGARVEVCNGLDDDCNGGVDEGFRVGTPCDNGQLGACHRTGTWQCDALGGEACDAPAIEPGKESCNGIDDDCDGQTDEAPLPIVGDACRTLLPGACEAGHLECVGGLLACRPDIEPGTLPETCNDQDDDCDGVVDDGFGVGTTCSVGVGACAAAGKTACDGTGGSRCDAVPGSPRAEDCNGLDDDCDGVADNGNPGGGVDCDSGLPGACQAGTTACQGGSLACLAWIAPDQQVETCNGLDDDCDGAVDDGFDVGQACRVGIGECQVAGVVACAAGIGVCDAVPGPPQPEACDGKDNDCDGTVDNGNPGGGVACDTGLPGLCAPGITACASPDLGCIPDVAPGTLPEVCDGVDDDCNGLVDEGFDVGGACEAGIGECHAVGVKVCSNDVSVCSAVPGPPRPETCDGTDDDCDGTVDNGNPGGGLACDTGLKGVCKAGITACTAGSVACVRILEPGAQVETCNDRDDDCDGLVDEGLLLPFHADADGDGFGDPATETWACQAPAGYVADETDCDDAAPTVHPGAAETACADGIDNDCDGTTDACARGTWCKAGTCTDQGDLGATCDGAGECLSGRCVDQRCCDSDCTGICEACDTAERPGSCVAVSGAPRGDRPACKAAVAICGGSCNGTARDRCVYPGPEVSCRTASCANGTAIQAAGCAGDGSCATEQAQECAPYLCEGDRCAGDCGDDGDCADTAFCSGGVCRDRMAEGQDCATDRQCQSGRCIDQVCCAEPCEGQCEACDDPQHRGRCVAITGAPHGGRPACGGLGACQGGCDGQATDACVFPGAETSCAEARCEDGLALPDAACNGQGACNAVTGLPCGDYACVGGACRSSCTTGDDCAAGKVCEANACVEPRPDTVEVVEPAPDAEAEEAPDAADIPADGSADVSADAPGTDPGTGGDAPSADGGGETGPDGAVADPGRDLPAATDSQAGTDPGKGGGGGSGCSAGAGGGGNGVAWAILLALLAAAGTARRSRTRRAGT